MFSIKHSLCSVSQKGEHEIRDLQYRLITTLWQPYFSFYVPPLPNRKHSAPRFFQ